MNWARCWLCSTYGVSSWGHRLGWLLWLLLGEKWVLLRIVIDHDKTFFLRKGFILLGFSQSVQTFWNFCMNSSGLLSQLQLHKCSSKVTLNRRWDCRYRLFWVFRCWAKCTLITHLIFWKRGWSLWFSSNFRGSGQVETSI